MLVFLPPSVCIVLLYTIDASVGVGCDKYVDVSKPVIYYPSVHTVKFVGSPEVAVVSVSFPFQIQSTRGLNLVTSGVSFVCVSENKLCDKNRRRPCCSPFITSSVSMPL